MGDPLAGRLAFLHTPLAGDRGEGVPLSGARQKRLHGSPCGGLLPDPAGRGTVTSPVGAGITPLPVCVPQQVSRKTAAPGQVTWGHGGAALLQVPQGSGEGHTRAETPVVLTVPVLLPLLSPSVMPDTCDPVDCSLSSSSAHGILQARILAWAATSSFRGSPPPRDGTCLSCAGRCVLYHERHLEARTHPALS